MVPLVEAKLSAGNGSFETSGDSERRYAFRSDFLRRKGNPNAMVLMRVAGDSMEPKIEHDDVVLVDTSQTVPHLGRMYAVAVEDLVYLKQVNAEPGKLILTSANSAYAPLEIDARGDQADGIRIIGRAIWVGRELD
jgi:phage repressor protein C with HTH and peptisase S24 domain